MSQVPYSPFLALKLWAGRKYAPTLIRDILKPETKKYYLRKINAVLTVVAGKERRLELASIFFGRKIESTYDITLPESIAFIRCAYELDGKKYDIPFLEYLGTLLEDDNE